MSRLSHQIELLTSLSLMATAHPDHLGQSTASQVMTWYQRVVEQGDTLDSAEAQQLEQLYDQFSYLLI